MEELLKRLGYTDEQIQKIIGGMKENKIYTTTEEKIEERYNKLKEQKVALDEQIKTANATIEDLKKNNTDNETLQSKIGEYESKVSDYEKQIQDMQFNYAIDGALKNANVKNTKAVKALLNLQNVKLDGESIMGLNDQLEALKKSDSYLFDATISGNEPGDGKSNPSPQEATDLRSALAQKYQ
ncbi:phage scaffolding protein [Clostridium sporogenes]|uniref:phage scaffolding protein n=1 Tax=Clostridium sporogenes TaxID=1509 RepID=UPI00223882B4|nr:phage scaffolding protein [Clostridium sporogenes]MCW6112447.1 phage scaffolding protein [Clostridium sporogenes]